MKAQKLILEEDLIVDYECIAIHTQVEDYHLAYLINKHLKLKLKRSLEDLDIKNGYFKFPLFEWKDVKTQKKWSLISNAIQQEVTEKPKNLELFDNYEIQVKKQYLISELKQVDFFLILRQELFTDIILSVMKVLNKIPQIMTSYKLDLNKIKYTEYLTLE